MPERASCKACGMAPVMRTLILVNTIVFCLESSFGDGMIVHLALWPMGALGDSRICMQSRGSSRGNCSPRASCTPP
jgi:hypothetical protein